jgi:hypothetical protein
MAPNPALEHVVAAPPHMDTDQMLSSVSADSPPQCHSILELDPARIYPYVHASTKRLYLDRVTELSCACGVTEHEICSAAIALASRNGARSSKEQGLLSHVGYYLLDKAGIEALRRHLGKDAKRDRSISNRVRWKRIVSIYLFATVCLCALFTWLFTQPGESIAIAALLICCLVVLAGFTVRNYISLGLSCSSRPHLLPELDLSRGVTAEHKTVVAIPAVLLGKDHVLDLIQVLKTHCSSIQDPNVLFVLLTDLPDSDHEHVAARDMETAEFCLRRITELNETPIYADSKPFFALHRQHRFCETQGRWIGWETTWQTTSASLINRIRRKCIYSNRRPAGPPSRCQVCRRAGRGFPSGREYNSSSRGCSCPSS